MTETKEQHEDDIVHVQTVMHRTKAQALKTKTGAPNLKKALIMAVDKYLEE